MKKKLLLISSVFLSVTAFAGTNGDSTGVTTDTIAEKQKAPVAETYAFGDFTWMNGNDRRHAPLLQSKYVTWMAMVDVNYSLSDQHPIDNTVVGSTALARNNELELSCAQIGGEYNYKNTRAKIALQLGTRATIIPRNDNSTNRGQYDLADAYRYISEAYAGRHFDVWHGINVDAGIFMSYIGLFSYYNAENWAYQPSYTSDNTPWFFNGIRTQIFPTEKLKVELWLINGWQSYGKFNTAPGAGFSLDYRPNESVKFITNDYIGTDTQDKPDRIRFHSDNSVLVRYYNRPSGFISRCAFSVTGDIGFENGDGVTAFGGAGGPAQNFISGMAYNRVWFGKDRHFGWTFGGGFMHNPGRYLVLVPTGVAGQQFDASPGTQFDAWDLSTTLDWMPDDHTTFRLEYVHRAASIPYFAGPGGVTSPDGYINTPIPAGWSPDLVKSESRIILALIVRL